ncbi:hypothetical protein SDRG_08487 [Saprolegnia diclina VS20]|uniref:Uncharacterized protein n=1 Tax=Saprolegnia diclina (strain VS20) TaxID=1156394 RepID=T0Q7E9_SAPDV|nr:hypothetical protein SDRG_08487 [Saprolegnia diclina VS20]EQC33804.1 hypothetical protein SDRG_08487 [Saprolegnia diclina VS20]|eukprot:XP_008612599.1 hypothetical protein SDRG_08487 [Saprolegnia diclina VS20]
MTSDEPGLPRAKVMVQQLGPHLDTLTPPPKLPALLGLTYILGSIGLGAYYLWLLDPSFANDLWWASYNLSGHQALLIDIANAALVTRGSGVLDLLAASMPKTYNVTPSFTRVHPTYARRLVLSERTSIEEAVAGLRTLSASWSMRLSTQLCFVDFARRFHVAHTSARQARCVAQYAANGAVYYESILRNLEWHLFQTAWGNYFAIAIQSGLTESPAGQQWLQTTSTAFNTTTLSDEIAYWKASGLTRFELQWQNRWTTGVSESMTIENALGWQQAYSVKSVARATGPWTTLVMNWLPYNDLWVLATLNRSAIAGTSNYFNANLSSSLRAIDLQAWSGFLAPTGPCDVLRFEIGPMPSIDTYYIAPPPSLIQLYLGFHAALQDEMTSSLAHSIEALPSVVLHPVPPTWVAPGRVFHGGNPTCYTGAGKTFVQESFEFHDACSQSVPLAMTSEALPMLFAAYASQLASVAAPCALQSSPQCATALGAAIAIVQSLPKAESVATVAADVTATGVGYMQFASDAGVFKLLRYGLLDQGGSAGWPFFGWRALYDWVEGSREVVSFQGDTSTVVLVSAAYSGDLYSTSGGSQNVQHATEGIWYVVVYTSLMLLVVAALCWWRAFGIQLHVRSMNLYRFNRVVGAVWIGRPLLLVRGGTALLLLSTAPTDIVLEHGYTSFVSSPRSFLVAAILAGEATWVTYVLNDVFLLIASKLAAVYAPMSCAFVWLIYVVLELALPLRMTGTLSRSCQATNVDFALSCESGAVRIGSLDRLLVLLGIQLGAVVVAMAMSIVNYIRTNGWQSETKIAPAFLSQAPLELSGAADSFLVSRTTSDAMWCLDKVTAIMCGLYGYARLGREKTFDLKLWVILDDLNPASTEKLFRAPQLSLAPPALYTSPLTELDTSMTQTKPVTDSALVAKSSTLERDNLFSFLQRALNERVVAVVGVLFVVASMAGSVSYISVAQVNLANDLGWASFNMTGAHAFLANWFNEQLVLGANSVASSFRLDSGGVAATTFYGLSTAAVVSPANFGARLQYTELQTEIAATIAALRSNDGCDAPWIFTQYCFVDFEKTWSMATSVARQQRCTSMTKNGAVYLESILRNVEWTSFRDCWGDAFDLAIGDALLTTKEGQSWLATTASRPQGSVADEAFYWAKHGITSYTTQWQNYKKIGLINSYEITNALGVSYPFTLQYLNGSMQVDFQSTFKMYWSLAIDWTLVQHNTSLLAGKSWVVGSSLYAFANHSMQDALAENGTITLPLNNVFTAATTTLGPFGSVDMMYIAPPATVLDDVRVLLSAIRGALAASATAQSDFNTILPIDAVRPVPQAWAALNLQSFGGSILCPQTGDSGDQRIVAGLINLFSYSIACSSNGIYTQVQPSREFIVLSTLLANVDSSADMPAICAQDLGHNAHCEKYLASSVAFVSTHVTSLDMNAISRRSIQQIQALNIELMQYVGDNKSASMRVLHRNILDANDPNFYFFGWWYLCDWLFGTREVVSFQGDGQTLNLLSEYLAPFSQDVVSWQFPTTLANYARSGALYVTVVMITISSLVFVYFVLSRGRIEGYNMMELSRVGAIVWVGRPLLLVRGLTAIAVLSTATLELQRSGSLSYFLSPTLSWVKTLLAAAEVTWLVAVVNDIGLIATHGFAFYYATPNSILAWTTVFILTRVAPVTHAASMAKVCAIVRVDYQVVCSSATIVIGDLVRLVALIGIVLCANITSYAIIRRVCNAPKPTQDSLFLSAGAKFLFTDDHWVHDGVYYLDRASAALNGILTFRRGRVIYALDIKVWRIFAIALPEKRTEPTDRRLALAAQYALPLTD